jgi:hypothetical protein
MTASPGTSSLAAILRVWPSRRTETSAGSSPRSFSAACCTLLLDVGEDPVDHHHHNDGNTQLRHPSDEGQHRGAPKHQGKEMRQLSQELAPLWHRLRGRKNVRPRFPQQRRGTFGAQAGRIQPGPGRTLSLRHCYSMFAEAWFGDRLHPEGRTV